MSYTLQILRSALTKKGLLLSHARTGNKCRVKLVLRRLYGREQHRFLHVVIAMGYTALYQITASFSQTQKKKFGVMLAGRQVLRQREDLRFKLCYWQGFYKHFFKRSHQGLQRPSMSRCSFVYIKALCKAVA